MRRQARTANRDLIHAYLVRRLELASQPAERLSSTALDIAWLVLVGLLAVAILWCAWDQLMQGGRL